MLQDGTFSVNLKLVSAVCLHSTSNMYEMRKEKKGNLKMTNVVFDSWMHVFPYRLHECHWEAVGRGKHEA